MPSLKSLLTGAIHSGEQSFDKAKAVLKERLQLNGCPQIVPYYGYANESQIFMRARALEDKSLTSVESDDSIWENMWRTYQRIESDEIPHAKVLATFDGQSAEFVADEEGYVNIALPLKNTLDTQALSTKASKIKESTVTLKFIDQSVPGEITSPVFIPETDAQFGIISDIDDTVMVSKATSYIDAARLMFTKNYQTRLPFPGVAAFYKALQQGTETVTNPIFYVSSSPWNLFEMLTDFMEHQQIPLGPLFLKDYGITENSFISSGHGNHKMDQIDTIMTTYPKLNFVLMGDSGQKDPEIYAEAANKYRSRILAIYIRDVSDDERDKEVEKIARQVERQGTPMIFARDSLHAAEHALSIGLIRQESLDSIKKQVA